MNNTMRKIVFFVFCVSIFGKALGQTWQPVTADVGFTAKMFGASVEGKFKKMGAVIKFDPENLGGSSIVANVDATTIDTDNSLRDRHMREKSDFFEVAKYPKITMKSTKIEKAGNGYVGYFELTVKSITKNLKVPFTFTSSGDKGTFNANVGINRRDWGIGGGTLGMSNDVTIKILVNTVSK